MKRLLTTLCALLFGHSASASEPNTDALYHHQLKRLHSAEVVDLRERFAGKPMLVINTASFCWLYRPV